MANGPSIHYETVATAFEVLDIAEPLVTTAPPDWTVQDVMFTIAEDTAEHSENWIALIRDDQTILGYVDNEFIWDEPGKKFDGPIDGTAGEYCRRITADQIVASNLPLLDLIPLFQEHFFYFVLNGNDLTHTVSFLDLNKLPVKLCLFALLTGLEAELIRLLSRSRVETETHLRGLPEQRLRSARDWCRTHYKDKLITPERILQATSLSDKVTMVLGEPAFLSALPFADKSQAEDFFAALRELRNRIAHSDTIMSESSTPATFIQMLSELRNVTDIVSNLASEPSQNGPP
jgi:hypothetical protein